MYFFGLVFCMNEGKSHTDSASFLSCVGSVYWAVTTAVEWNQTMMEPMTTHTGWSSKWEKWPTWWTESQHFWPGLNPGAKKTSPTLPSSADGEIPITVSRSQSALIHRVQEVRFQTKFRRICLVKLKKKFKKIKIHQKSQTRADLMKRPGVEMEWKVSCKVWLYACRPFHPRKNSWVICLIQVTSAN